MIRGSELDEYLVAVSRRLRVGRRLRRRILREIEDHLRQALAEAGMRPSDEGATVRDALECFGSPLEVADAFSAVHRRGSSGQKRKVVVLVTACALALAGLSFAGSRLDKPVFAILFDNDRTVRKQGGGILFEPPAAVLVRVNPRTLRPLPGRRVQLLAGTGLHTLSPDRSRLAGASYPGARIRFVDLARMRRLGDLTLASNPLSRIRALAWVRPDRVLVIVQRMSKPYARRVVARTLVTVDPTARRVLNRRALPRTAVRYAVVAGERFVFTQEDSNHRSPIVRLVVAEPSGSFRSRALNVGKVSPSGMRRGVGVTLDPSGERAFVAVSSGRLIEIELDILATREHRPRLPAAIPAGLRPSVWSLSPYIHALDEHRLLASHFFTRNVGGQMGLPIAGVWLIDTRGGRARVLDPRAPFFLVAERTILTYGSGAVSGGPRSRAGQGVGVAAYSLEGKLRYRLYSGKHMQRIAVADGYLHTFGSPSRDRQGRLVQRPRAVFDLETGRNLGRVSKPPLGLLLVDADDH